MQDFRGCCSKVTLVEVCWVCNICNVCEDQYWVSHVRFATGSLFRLHKLCVKCSGVCIYKVNLSKYLTQNVFQTLYSLIHPIVIHFYLLFWLGLITTGIGERTLFIDYLYIRYAELKQVTGVEAGTVLCVQANNE